MRPRAAFPLVLAALVVPASPARADWRLFLPRAVENGAYMELFGSSERDATETGAPRRRVEWRDDFLKEKLSLFSNGYVYHPKFLLYHVSVGGAAKQEDYSASFLPPFDRSYDTGLEYEARVVLLPEHPYTLQLFTLRYEPVFKERSAVQHGSREASSGGDFNLQRDPYRLHARYVDDKIQTGPSTATVQRGTLEGGAVKQLSDLDRFSLAASYAPSRFRRTGGFEGEAQEASLVSSLGGGRFNLGGEVTWSTYDQTEGGGQGHTKSETLAWSGQFGADLPFHFRTDLGYGWRRSETRFPNAVLPIQRQLDETGYDARFSLLHKLYQSLDSSYTFDRTARSSTGGESTADSHFLDFAYGKSIPRGRLQAGLNLGQTLTDSAGRSDVADEPHLGVGVPGSFRLGAQRVEASSVAIFMRSPIEPFELVRLDEGTHYTLTPIADTFEVNVFALPPSFLLPGTYDFHAAYTLVGGEFELRSRTLGNRASVELFDGLLNPYYNYSRARSEVLAGVFPGSGLESTSWTTGVASRYGPWRLRVEYQQLEWDVTPYHSWRGELQYHSSAGQNTTLSATLTRIRKSYETPGGDSRLAPHTETTSAATGNLQQSFFARRLALSLGGSYSRLEGSAQSRAWAVNSSLLWRVGKLELLAGATGYWSQTVGASFPDSERRHRYYYLRARRRLF